MSLVSFVKVTNNAEDSIRQAILESLNAINYSFEKEVKNVVIKPNLCYYWDYSTGQTTDPRFMAELIDLIREEISPNADISVVESDASAMKCKYAFKILGYEKLAEDYKVNLTNLSTDPYRYVQVKAGTQSFRMMVPQTIEKADLKINVPKIKYAMKGIELTCALKNIFGCNPYPRKFRYHPYLGEAIVASNKAMKFDLCIVDGNIVSGIQPRRLGLVMASRDFVAIDAAAAKIAGLNPKKIKYIKLANKEGLGNISFIPKGAPISHFRSAYPRKDVKKKLMGNAYSLVTRLRMGRRLGLE
jgi:uncharacterized protein (DUF362 family)